MKTGDKIICKKNYYGPEYGRSFITKLLIWFSDIFKIYLKKRIFKKNESYMIMEYQSKGRGLLVSTTDYYNIDNIWFYDDYLSKFFFTKNEYRKIKLKKLNEI